MGDYWDTERPWCMGHDSVRGEGKLKITVHIFASKVLMLRDLVLPGQCVLRAFSKRNGIPRWYPTSTLLFERLP